MKRKNMILTGIMTLIMAVAGCGNAQEDDYNDVPEILSFPDITNNRNEDTTIPPDLTHDNESSSTDISLINEDEPAALAQDSDYNLIDISQDAIFIGGKVRSISQDSFVISRTLMDDAYVIMPEAGSPDEVLVTIQCSDSTAYEHWTIQGGGAGITKKDAAFSDIKIDDGLEALGHFDGDIFIAEKVILEFYK